jgi:chromosome segregation ATPase
MTQSCKAMIVLLVAALGLWGCARTSTPHWSAHAERIRSLEAKCVKMEDEYRGVVSTRDQMRKHLASLEAENIRLDKTRQDLTGELEQARTLQQEVEQLKKLVESRTSERDLLQVRCERLKKGLQSLIGQDETPAAAPATSPVNTSTEPASGGQS